MIRYICDLCGASLKEQDIIYELNIQVHAIYQPLKIDLVDLLRDHTDEIRQLVEALEDSDPQELQDQVYKTFKFHLCPSCQRKYTRDPLSPRNDASETGSSRLPEDNE